MPNYTFELRDGPIEDDVGVILTDRQDAYQYARGVVSGVDERPRSPDPDLAP
jgi:hypothetical protein